jgi:phenylacetate-coenzyme A ligase PaaK-like adenylate-forming protein
METVTGRSDDMVILRGVNFFPTRGNRRNAALKVTKCPCTLVRL